MTEAEFVCKPEKFITDNESFFEECGEVDSNITPGIYSLNEDTIDQFQEELQTLPEVLSYINYLQICLQKQNIQLESLSQIIKNYQTQLNKKCETHEKSTQTEDKEEVDTPWVTDGLQNQSSSLAEQVREAAENALQSTNFVYEETSGMYYDYSTGYYYNAEQGLYYDGNNGIYYSYDSTSGTFVFHSQIDSSQNVQEIPEERKRKKSTRKTEKANKKSKIEDTLENQDDNEENQIPNRVDTLEEGECTDSEPDEESESSSDELEDSDCSKAYPPCMRIIVKESNLEDLKIGTLFIVTYTGGTLGREGDHSVLIPDINISKHHAKLSFEDGKYVVVDFGSRNGTYLNGVRLSAAKLESEPYEVVHGSIIQVGGTKLLCHIHLGNDTCGHCEPGLLQQPADNKSGQTVITKSISHKKGLKKLQRKLCPPVPDLTRDNTNQNYQDRAELRRSTVGSQNEHEKTQTASLNEPIRSDNKGFKLLSKMGWSEGEALGKDKDGSTEPIPLLEQRGTAGLGSEGALQQPSTPASSSGSDRRVQRWKKAKQRYDALS